MALFKISKGSKLNLPAALTEGYCWYTYDDSKFYIDFKDADGTLVRKALNANEAEKLTGYDIATILKSSDVEIPTSKAVLDSIAEATKDIIAVEGGATLTLEDIFGEAPYTIEIEPEADSFSASDINYDNSVSGLSATDVQTAIDELKSLTEAAPTSTDYSTYRLRNTAILSAVPETMNNGDIALVYI